MAETVVRRSMADLPEPIIHHILSYLSGDQAAQTTVLCKAWLNAWLTRPTLVFSSAFFFSKKKKRTKEICWHPPDRDEIREYNNFAKYVERSFDRYHKQKTSIDTIELEIDKGVFDWKPVIRRCIQVAAEDSVKNLKLSLCDSELPEILFFEAKSLVDLTLSQVKLVERSTEKIKPLDRLKRLSLNYVEFYDVPFESLISCCQLVEILEISYCKNGNDSDQYFKVAGQNALKELIAVLSHPQTLILCEAPSLESLTCKSDGKHGQYPCFLNLHSSQYENLKSLLLSGVGIGDAFFVNLAHDFPHLESLSVQYCQDLRNIKISSPSLKRIQLVRNWGLRKAQFDVPSIIKFEYDDRKCRIIPEFSFAAASSRWVSCFTICTEEDAGNSCFLQLKKLVASLAQSAVSLKLMFRRNEAFNLGEATKDAGFDEPQVVQELFSKSIDWNFRVSSAYSMLDVIFWVCRPKAIVDYWIDRPRYNERLHSLYTKLMFRKNHEQFHNSQQMKFWQSDLREVKVEIFHRCVIQSELGLDFILVGQGEQLEETLDCKDFLSFLRTRAPNWGMMIKFNLDWETN
ncbi:probable FBD-associated F-box protein At1g32375 [Coffea arabica]|uniref:Probable FBD-associated F-box protein At1g32375 n=1 Tax=Coffea arabica TaxID=13443 RepID=A0ABM4X5U1_COFAR